MGDFQLGPHSQLLGDCGLAGPGVGASDGWLSQWVIGREHSCSGLPEGSVGRWGLGGPGQGSLGKWVIQPELVMGLGHSCQGVSEEAAARWGLGEPGVGTVGEWVMGMEWVVGMRGPEEGWWAAPGPGEVTHSAALRPPLEGAAFLACTTHSASAKWPACLQAVPFRSAHPQGLGESLKDQDHGTQRQRVG